MQAVITKYLPATDFKGSRIKASCERGSLTIGYPHDLSGDEVHIKAANELCAKFAKEDEKQRGTPVQKNPWPRSRVCGTIKSGLMAHVFVS